MDLVQIPVGWVLGILGLWGAGGVWVGLIQTQVTSMLRRLDDRDEQWKDDARNVAVQIAAINTSTTFIQTQLQELKIEIAKEYMSKADVQQGIDKVMQQVSGVSTQITDLTVQIARFGRVPRRPNTNGQNRTK